MWQTTGRPASRSRDPFYAGFLIRRKRRTRTAFSALCLFQNFLTSVVSTAGLDSHCLVERRTWHSDPVAVCRKTVTCRTRPPEASQAPVSRPETASIRAGVPGDSERAQREPAPIRSREFMSSRLPGSSILPRRPVAVALGEHVEDEV
jgi:hypothetical protein